MREADARPRLGRPGAFLVLFLPHLGAGGPAAHPGFQSLLGPGAQLSLTEKLDSHHWADGTGPPWPARGRPPPQSPRRQAVSQPRSPASAEPARTGLHKPVHLGPDRVSPALGSPPAPELWLNTDRGTSASGLANSDRPAKVALSCPHGSTTWWGARVYLWGMMSRGQRAIGCYHAVPGLRLRAFSWKCRRTGQRGTCGHFAGAAPGALSVSPACVALLALPEDGVRERRGWGPEVEGVGGEGLQGAAGFCLHGRKALQLLSHGLDG